MDKKVAEHTYYRFFSHGVVGMYLSTPEGRFLDVNRAFAKMIGYRSPKELMENILDIPGQLYVRSEVRERMKRILANKKRVENFEVEIYRKDGSSIWVSNSLAVEENASGEKYYSGSCVDITERKRLEQKVRAAGRALRVRSDCGKVIIHATEEQELLDRICRIVSDAAGYSMVWVGYAENDPEKSIRPVAQVGADTEYIKTLRLTWADTERGQGLSGAAIRTGRPAVIRHALTDPELAPWRREDAAKRGYASGIALPLLLKGKSFGILTINSAEPDAFDEEEEKLLSALAEDISYAIGALREQEARRKAEEALSSERELLLTLINHIPDAIFYKNAEGRYVFANKAKLEQFGIKRQDQIVGKTVFDFFPEESAKAFAAEDRETVKSGRVLHVWEERIATPRGDIRWHLNTKVPVPDAKGKITGLITISRNVTEQKLAEEALKKSLEEKETLLKEIQHRVKNNLNLVSSLLNLGMGETESGDARRIFLSAQSRIRSIASLYEHLYQSKDLRTVELHRYIKNLAEKLIPAYALDPRKIRLVTRLEKTIIDTRRSVSLGLILNELLTNAMKYAYPEGRGGEILVELTKTKDRIRIGVSDYGVGLPEGAGSEKSGPLGMRLVNLLTEQIGGKLRIRSKPGQGTSIQVSFKP